MCGIAGAWQARGLGALPVEKVAKALRHRGPDEWGSYTDRGLTLIHTRLSIIDLEHGHQPLTSTDPELVLIANGEIYNHVELRAGLERRGRPFTTRSDSEAILHAYAEYGSGFLPHLHGMFAFALYDKGARRLILARDRLGIKPLYYALLPDRFVFASEIKALLPLLPRTPGVNARALAQFLQSQFSTGEETIVEGVYRLPPGEALTVDADLHIERRRYWSALDIETRPRSLAQACEEFDALMEEVMREHIRSDVPYGLFLSGGVYAGVLAALFSRDQERPVRTFSVGYKAEQQGELDAAQRVARLFGTDHTPLLLEREEVFGYVPRMVWAADDLMRDYACLPTAILAEHAARELKVVFTGEGGDEVFAGYGRYRKSGLQRFFKNLLAPGSGGFRTRGQWHRRWAARTFTPQLQALSRAARQPFVDAWQSAPDTWSDVQRSQYTDLVTALPDNLLVKADRMLMAAGLEGRVPYLDHRVVEFGLSLPDELKVCSRRGKVFLRRWAERHLPADHLHGKKQGFHVPVGEWLRGHLLDRLAERLPRNPAVREWFRPQAVRDLLAHQRGGGNASREIWCLMQFAIWHYLFLEEHDDRVPSGKEDLLDWMS